MTQEQTKSAAPEAAQAPGTSEGALSVRPSLADPAAAAELFACAASDFLHAVYAAPETASGEDGDVRVARIVFGLAALFEDQSGIVELPLGFSTAAAGARLRPSFARRLAAMSPEDRSLFDDDAQIVTLAVNVFFEELLMTADAWFQTTGRAPDDGAFHDFLAQAQVHAWLGRWAERILGVSAE